MGMVTYGGVEGWVVVVKRGNGSWDWVGCGVCSTGDRSKSGVVGKKEWWVEDGMREPGVSFASKLYLLYLVGCK
jgi:hypothetical protein